MTDIQCADEDCNEALGMDDTMTYIIEHLNTHITEKNDSLIEAEERIEELESELSDSEGKNSELQQQLDSEEDE